MDKNHESELETQRLRYAFWLAVAGLGFSGVLVIFLVVVAKMRTSADIVAIVGVFTSVTGTLVGAFFGVQIGSAGREQEREERRYAEKMATMAMGKLDPVAAGAVMKEMQGEYQAGNEPT
jgi:hypothetical protein